MAVTQTIYNKVAPNNVGIPAILNTVGSYLISMGYDPSSNSRLAIYDGVGGDASLYEWSYAYEGLGTGVPSPDGTLYVLGNNGGTYCLYELDPTTGAAVIRGTGYVPNPGGISNGRLFVASGNYNLSTWTHTYQGLTWGRVPPIVVGNRVFGRTASNKLREYTNDDLMTTVATYTMSTWPFYFDEWSDPYRCIRDGVIWFPTNNNIWPLYGFNTATNSGVGFAPVHPLPTYSSLPVVLNPADGYLYQVSSDRSQLYVFNIDISRVLSIDANDSYPLSRSGVPYDGAMWFTSHVRI